ESSGNRTLTTVTRLLHTMLANYYTGTMHRTDQELMFRAVRGYRKFVRLIRARDAEGAAKHWRATMQFTIGEENRNDPGKISPAGGRAISPLGLAGQAERRLAENVALDLVCPAGDARLSAGVEVMAHHVPVAVGPIPCQSGGTGDVGDQLRALLFEVAGGELH